MNISMAIEIAGYIGSVLVVVSMLMSSVIKLRIINTTGSSISAIYALIIHSYPLALMNICLVVINIYNLSKLLKSDKHFDLIDGNTDDKFLEHFIDYYKDDMINFFPEKNIDTSIANTAYIVSCKTVPAGILLGKMDGDGTLNIAVDYTTPVYRDCSVGSFLYSKLPEKGVKKLVYSGEAGAHEAYLQKMGFKSGNGKYVKYL
ncbi:MAG: YgjV family protein [Lachnospiraceae bacterium]|nr:YgjV family protein [Lachnospiraceae bacterium]